MSTIPVVCPRGHRIGVPTVHHDPGQQLRIELSIKGLRAVWADEYQHDPASGRTLHEVTIECPHRGCRYRGHFHYSTLAAGLSAALAAGKPEYRLTS